jgi:hypothetical protein
METLTNCPEKQPLFEKSSAKTFAPLGRWQRNQHGPD